MNRFVIQLLMVLLMLTHSAVARAEANPFPNVPGVVVLHSPASSGIYLGSPGIAKFPDGALLMKCDEFGPKSTERKSAITHVFRSTDQGATWTLLTTIDGLFWSNLLVHHGDLYMIGPSCEYGPLVVLKSTDGGATWTKPLDGKTGLIRDGQWHTAAVGMVEHAGRLWRAVESADASDKWGSRFQPCVMSIPVDGDLLDASQWTVTPPMPRDGVWLGGAFQYMLEGNIVLDRDGHLRNILRTDKPEMAAVATVSDDGKSLFVDPQFDRSAFPGTDKKFMIRWDEQAKLYWMLANPVAPADVGHDSGGTRNTLALFASPDLRTWTRRCVLLHHDDADHYAFQYPDFIIDGDDMLIASRTAFDDGMGGAPRGHDANFLTFHRIKNFRNLKPQDGPDIDQRPASSEWKAGAFVVRGYGFERAKLADGGRAFSNRDYVWRQVPDALRGATTTIGAGGFRGKIEVEATRDGDLFVATALSPDESKDAMSGFVAVPEWSFSYSDRGQTKMLVYKKTMKAGERVTLPGGSWTGCLPLIRE